MSEHRGYLIQTGIALLVVVGGGWYFIKHYEVSGLDRVSVRPKSGDAVDADRVSFAANRSDPLTPGTGMQTASVVPAASQPNPFTSWWNGDGLAGKSDKDDSTAGPDFDSDTSVIRNTFAKANVPVATPNRAAVPTHAFRNLRIASWAMGGFGPTKLRDPMIRKNVIRILRQFDVIAFQQVSSIERDVIPRLIDAVNEGQSEISGASRYDFILSNPNSAAAADPLLGEQMGFIFDTSRVQADRTQTYTVSDPSGAMSHDPLVAWFRAAEPSPSEAWTFSMVNVRIELTRARDEVALLSGILKAVAEDGRGEDDIVLAGLFQADDAYLIPSVAGGRLQAVVHSSPTDVFANHQTSNILVRPSSTSEYLGRGGPLNFLRVYNLSLSEAEAISPHLPVYGEFTAVEGGHL
ncbi:exonuclease/endonuclease/phosphatase family protein [Crateriforma spongiae]|uniref:deoxyribonuclease I n=1 Tax=Crateriforma spongiae TaxID=2724528 RepID=UPI001448190C|nr:deoxyribonuclease I [Crateriforma spongiae]